MTGRGPLASHILHSCRLPWALPQHRGQPAFSLLPCGPRQCPPTGLPEPAVHHAYGGHSLFPFSNQACDIRGQKLGMSVPEHPTLCIFRWKVSPKIFTAIFLFQLDSDGVKWDPSPSPSSFFETPTGKWKRLSCSGSHWKGPY